MKSIWLWLAIIVVAIGGYMALLRTSKKADGIKVRIGVIAPLSGIAADYGAEMKEGVEASFGGTDAEFIYEDDKCDPKEAVTVYKKLVDFDKVNLIIGPACGSPQEAVAPLMKGAEILAVVPSAASQKLYAESGENMYDMQYALESEAAFLARQMHDTLKYEKVAVISYQNAFSKTLADSFKEAYGEDHIAKEVIFTGTEKDISSGLLKLKGAEYDAIFSTDISFFFAQGLKKLKDLGITQPVFSSYAVELPALRPLVEGVAYSFPGDMAKIGKGAIYELSKQSAELLIAKAGACKGDYACTKEGIDGSGMFDGNGTSVRDLVLKRIKNGVPEAY